MIRTSTLMIAAFCAGLAVAQTAVAKHAAVAGSKPAVASVTPQKHKPSKAAYARAAKKRAEREAKLAARKAAEKKASEAALTQYRLSDTVALKWPRKLGFYVTPLTRNGDLQLDGTVGGKPVSVWVMRSAPRTMARKSVVDREWAMIKLSRIGTMTEASCEEVSAINFKCQKAVVDRKKQRVDQTYWFGAKDVVTLKFSSPMTMDELKAFTAQVRVVTGKDISPRRQPATAARAPLKKGAGK